MKKLNLLERLIERDAEGTVIEIKEGFMNYYPAQHHSRSEVAYWNKHGPKVFHNLPSYVPEQYYFHRERFSSTWSGVDRENIPILLCTIQTASSTLERGGFYRYNPNIRSCIDEAIEREQPQMKGFYGNYPKSGDFVRLRSSKLKDDIIFKDIIGNTDGTFKGTGDIWYLIKEYEILERNSGSNQKLI